MGIFHILHAIEFTLLKIAVEAFQLGFVHKSTSISKLVKDKLMHDINM